MQLDNLNMIHEGSLHLLKKLGVALNSQAAIEVFRHHGFATENRLVFFKESQITKAIESVPAHFKLHARNPFHDLEIGKGEIALAPGYGAPYYLDKAGGRRLAIRKDYNNFCKLVQTSHTINMNGFMMGTPSDLNPATCHLDMLLDSICLCDKPFMGSPLSKEAAQDSVNLAQIVFGTTSKPVMVSNINVLQPLQYSGEMIDSLMVFAQHGQPVIIMGGGIRGATTPIQLPSMLTMQNSVILAGLVLSQIINPGTPVIYGVGGNPMDMQNGAYYVGSPEFLMATKAGCAMAKFYNLPCRGGGALTDAHIMDFQAGYQSAFAIAVAFQSEVDFVLHACGILGAYLTMSLEKFVADEEICQHSKKAFSQPTISSEAIDLQSIIDVGVGGEYLTHPTTFQLCRSEFLRLPLANRLPFEQWSVNENRFYEEKASKLVQDRLAKYETPAIDTELIKTLEKYVHARKMAAT